MFKPLDYLIVIGAVQNDKKSGLLSFKNICIFRKLANSLMKKGISTYKLIISFLSDSRFVVHKFPFLFIGIYNFCTYRFALFRPVYGKQMRSVNWS